MIGTRGRIDYPGLWRSLNVGLAARCLNVKVCSREVGTCVLSVCGVYATYGQIGR